MSKAKIRSKRIKQPIAWVVSLIQSLGDEAMYPNSYRHGQYKILLKLKGLIKAGK